MCYVKSQLKVMPTVSCFKRLTYLFLFIAVEITFQLWLKINSQQTSEALAWGSYCGEMAFTV